MHRPSGGGHVRGGDRAQYLAQCVEGQRQRPVRRRSGDVTPGRGQDIDHPRAQRLGLQHRYVGGHPAVHQQPPVHLDRRVQAGERARGQQGRSGRPAGEDHRRARAQVGRHHMRRNGRAVQRGRKRGAAEQVPERRVGHQAIPAAECRGEQRPGRELGDFPAAQRHPYRFQPIQARLGGISGERHRVQRPGRGADDQIRQHARLVQRPQHAHLRRGQAAATLEDECDAARLGAATRTPVPAAQLTEGPEIVRKGHRDRPPWCTGSGCTVNRLGLSASLKVSPTGQGYPVAPRDPGSGRVGR